MAYTSEIETEIRRSSEMLRFESDWDDEGAPRIAIEAWLPAVAFLRDFDGPAPSITPGPEGGVDMRWETDARELLIHFRADTYVLYYGDDRSGQDRRKGEIECDADRLALLAWIKGEG